MSEGADTSGERERKPPAKLPSGPPGAKAGDAERPARLPQGPPGEEAEERPEKLPDGPPGKGAPKLPPEDAAEARPAKLPAGPPGKGAPKLPPDDAAEARPAKLPAGPPGKGAPKLPPDDAVEARPAKLPAGPPGAKQEHSPKLPDGPPGRKGEAKPAAPRPPKLPGGPPGRGRKKLPARIRWTQVRADVDACLPHDGDHIDEVGIEVESGGRVNGDVCARAVKVLPNACVTGAVLASERVDVQNGTVEGTVVADAIRSNGRTGGLLARKVELARGADVHGDVQADAVELEGAVTVSGVLSCGGSVHIPPGSRVGGVEAETVKVGRGSRIGYVKANAGLELEADVQLGDAVATRLQASSALRIGSLRLTGDEPLRLPQGSRVDLVECRGAVDVESEVELSALLTDGDAEVRRDAEIGSILQARGDVTVHPGAAVREIVSAGTVSLSSEGETSIESCLAVRGIVGREVELRVSADGTVVPDGQAAGRLASRALTPELYRAYREAGVAALRVPLPPAAEPARPGGQEESA